MKFIRKIMVFLNFILILLTIGSYISPYINPNKIWMFSVLGLSYPILLFLNVLMVLYWFFVEFKYSFLSITILLIGFFQFRQFWAINSPKVEQETNKISVISYNISNAAGAYDKDASSRKEKKAKMEKFLSRFADEDILCFQEVGGYANDILKKSFSKHSMHQLNKGAIIMSRHPIVKSGEINFGTITNSCLWADIRIGLDTARVYSIHLQSNSITNDANKVLDEPDLNDDKTWIGIKGIFKKYVKNHITRSKQALIVKDHINKSPYPVIVCGDFNDTPLTFTYKKLSEGLVDDFTEGGNGLGTTFNGRIPLLRIDYILSDPAFKVHNFNIIKEDYSDHYPIASIISL